MIKIYEVMAVEHNLPLFFFDHITRFRDSLNEYKHFSVSELSYTVKNLMIPFITEMGKFNLKVTYSVTDDTFSITKSLPRKPPNENYITGCKVGLFNGERKNPLIKQENSELRDVTESICKENNFYDLLLINKNGMITEGSRSNFLLIDKDNRIITSPIGEALNGITRKVIFNICREQGLVVLEKEISRSDLMSGQSLIITGTSPEILPVANCETKTFNVANSIISLLQTEFKKKKLEDRDITRKIFNGN